MTNSSEVSTEDVEQQAVSTLDRLKAGTLEAADSLSQNKFVRGITKVTLKAVSWIPAVGGSADWLASRFDSQTDFSSIRERHGETIAAWHNAKEGKTGNDAIFAEDLTMRQVRTYVKEGNTIIGEEQDFKDNKRYANAMMGLGGVLTKPAVWLANKTGAVDFVLGKNEAVFNELDKLEKVVGHNPEAMTAQEREGKRQEAGDLVWSAIYNTMKKNGHIPSKLSPSREQKYREQAEIFTKKLLQGDIKIADLEVQLGQVDVIDQTQNEPAIPGKTQKMESLMCDLDNFGAIRKEIRIIDASPEASDTIATPIPSSMTQSSTKSIV